MNIVWFKRDFRIHDHRPLWEAAHLGPVVALYIDEPDYWAQTDVSARHRACVAMGLKSLDEDLSNIGLRLQIFRGSALEAMTWLHERLGHFQLFSHEETGNNWTFQRDMGVRGWCQAHGITWKEFRQFGVVRGLKSREKSWSKQWHELMDAPRIPTPSMATLHDMGLNGPHRNPGNQTIQEVSRQAAEVTLSSFLQERGMSYHRHISSPITAEHSSSRLSVHLAYGTISLREAYQSIAKSSLSGRARQAVLSRLHWHCHFIQKLESEPEIEFREFHPLYEGLRDAHAHEANWLAWAEGRTGWPFLDACMRCLNSTGWMNFRMRAMLTAVASYHLFQPWRWTALHLARAFSDYEPGIHYSQIQMQSGTTGINTLRIYNPVKQGLDQDPEGKFIARWVPELAILPAPLRHEPWKASPIELADVGLDIGTTYPLRIMDHEEAARRAKKNIADWRRGRISQFREVSQKVQNKHGSKKSGMARTGQKRSSHRQMDMFGEE